MTFHGHSQAFFIKKIIYSHSKTSTEYLRSKNLDHQNSSLKEGNSNLLTDAMEDPTKNKKVERRHLI